MKGELNARPRRFSRNDALDVHADGAREIVADLHLAAANDKVSFPRTWPDNKPRPRLSKEEYARARADASPS